MAQWARAEAQPRRRHAPPRERGTPIWDIDMDDDDPRHAPRPQSTLDRLENWLGLRASPAPAPSAPPAPPAHAPARPADTGSAAQVLGAHSDAHLVDVLVHHVAPSDTLSSIALRYGADVTDVRRSNRLWLGDAVQMRAALYIPVACCRWKPPHAEIRVLERAPDGSLGAQVELVGADGRHAVAVEKGTRTRGPQDYGASGVDDLLEDLRARPVHAKPSTSAPQPARAAAPRPPRAAAPEPAPERAPEPLLEPLPAPLPADRPPRARPARPARRALLDDLSQSLAPNTGTAAHWVRPIHESVPDARAPPRPSGSLFGDMVRGRISVEDAVGAALHEIHARTRAL